jgi:hypothetical protein
MGEGGHWNRAARRSGGYWPYQIKLGRLDDGDYAYSAPCAGLKRHDAGNFAECQCQCHKSDSDSEQ